MKIKDGGEEHTPENLFEVDLDSLERENNCDLTEARREAYISGFNRGQDEAYYGFWNSECRQMFREDTESKDTERREHFWVPNNEWEKSVGRTAENIVTAAYQNYTDGKNTIEQLMESITTALKKEFEATKRKQDAEMKGEEAPLTEDEKWLAKTEMPDKVCFLTLTREALREGRKEGYDVGFIKGYLSSQSLNPEKITGKVGKKLAKEIYDHGFDEGRRDMTRKMYRHGLREHWITVISGENEETYRRWLREELEIEEEKKRRDEEEKRCWEIYEFKKNTVINMYKYGYSVEDISRITRIDIEKVRRWTTGIEKEENGKKPEE